MGALDIYGHLDFAQHPPFQSQRHNRQAYPTSVVTRRSLPSSHHVTAPCLRSHCIQNAANATSPFYTLFVLIGTINAANHCSPPRK